MRSPAPDASSLPMNVLFPEAYRASCRMIVRDFLVYGGCIVVGAVGLGLALG